MPTIEPQSNTLIKHTLEDVAEASGGHDLVVKRLMQDDLRRKEKVDSVCLSVCLSVLLCEKMSV